MLLEICFIGLVLVVAVLAAVMVGIVGEMKALRTHVTTMTTEADRALAEAPEFRKRIASVERQCVGINRVLRRIESSRQNNYRWNRKNVDNG